MNPSFEYATGSLTPAEAADLQPSFHTLTPSAYKDGAYRLRRYSKFRYRQSSGHMQLQANSQFVQSDELNRFQGNVARSYDDLTADTIASAGFAAMFRCFAATADLPDETEIEVHQMRIIAQSADQAAESTPEGIHQDGFDRIGVFTAAHHNAEGGELYVWRSPEDAAPLVACLPQAGDFCVLNDRQLWHSASAVRTRSEAEAGYWDLFVLTAKQS